MQSSIQDGIDAIRSITDTELLREAITFLAAMQGNEDTAQPDPERILATAAAV